MIEHIKHFFIVASVKIENFFLNVNSAIYKLILESAIILLVCVLILHWLDGKLHNKVAQTNSVVAITAPIVKDEPVAQIEIKKPVRVFKNSQKIKQKVKLPESVIQNENAQVLTAITIPKDKFDKTVTTILDTDTGIATTYVKDEPLPWLSLNRHGTIGLYGGIKNGTTAIRLQANQGIVDIKDIHINAIGSLDQTTNGNTDYFVGIGATYNW